MGSDLKSAGRCPVSAASESRAWCNCLYSGGRVPSNCASAASCANTSASAIAPRLELAVEDRERLALERDHALRAGYLGPQPGLLNRRRDHVRDERQVGRIELKPARLGLCLERFHLAPVAAENIRNVRHR